MVEGYDDRRVEFKRKKTWLNVMAVFAIISIGLVLYKGYFDKVKAGDRSSHKVESAAIETKNSKEVFDAEYVVKEGDTLSLILESLNTKKDERIKVIEAFEKTYSPTKIKVGNVFKVKFEDDKISLRKMVYAISLEKDLVIAKNSDDEFVAEEKEIVFDIKIATKGNKITSSLFESGGEIGLSAGTILLMADVFSGEIDFSTDIQEGDSFKIIYEEKYKDGIRMMEGNILAAEFHNQGWVYRSFYFVDSGNASSYFDEKGQSLKKAFLKSPLNFRYISSGYTTSRYHPILKVMTSHRAIDYVASAGTPVVTVGDGKILIAAWRNDYGNYVAVRHSNGYVTYYGHLSGFAKGIRVGVPVVQGQTIGFVGSTGFSTGAHLDYSMKLNGAYINPMNVNVVVGDPISKASKEEFSAYAEKMIKTLESLQN